MGKYGGWRFITVAAALFGFIILVTVRLERLYTSEREDNRREAVFERLGLIRYQLERELTNNLSLLSGIAAFISTNPDFTAEEYHRYADAVRRRQPAILNLAAAPDLVIRHIHPVEGNEAALGLDYRESEAQWAEVRRVVERREMLMAGPVELIQGGVAFVGRAPVLVEDGESGDRLWGIVAAPVAAADIFAAAGLPEAAEGMELAIRRGGKEGSSSTVFYGVDALFEEDSGVMTMPVAMGEMSWELAARPTGAGPTGPGVAAIRAAGGMMGLLLMGVLVSRRQRQREGHAMARRIQNNERFLRAVEEISAVGGWRLTPDLYFTRLSDHARRLLGVESEVLPVPLERAGTRLQPASRESLKRHFIEAVRGKAHLERELDLIRKDGSHLWLRLQGQWYEDGRGNAGGQLTGAIQDISKVKKAEQVIEYQANFDALTDLPNRNLFNDRLRLALRKARRHSTRLAVLFIDLDDFKSVNDNQGHRAGDRLLEEAATRIRQSVRDTDTVARYSGDEFVVVLEDLLSTSVAGQVCEQIVHSIGRPFHVGTAEVYCGVSIGVSFCPEDGEDGELLVIKADQAMYKVKESGKNSWQFYLASMQLESESRHRMYNELVRALESDALEVWFQPVYDRLEQTFSGCEALVRWQCEDGSWVSPEAFVAVAEERGLISRLDQFVLDHALAVMARVQSVLGRALLLSVNVSPRLLRMRDDAAHAWLESALSAATPLMVEITERVLVDDAASARPTLQTLTDSGVEVSIDDFGTGYSGLGYFSRFPIRVLKVDRSFIAGIGQSETDERLIESILLMAERLGVRVIAEGVETEEQLAFLRDAGCDFLQGYLLARPMPEGELIRFLSGYSTNQEASGGKPLNSTEL